MANTNAPFGFRQYRGSGSSPTYEQFTQGAGGLVGGILYSNSGAIYFGDPVIRSGVGAGSLIAGVGSGSVVPVAGIFQGCKYLSTSQKRTVWSNYWPGVDVRAPILARPRRTSSTIRMRSGSRKATRRALGRSTSARTWTTPSAPVPQRTGSREPI